jgi:hypothetical protein
VWQLTFMILLSCLIGIGFWLSTDPMGGAPMVFKSKMNMAYAEQLREVVPPEIDLQLPETTEIALFALG